MMNIAPPTELLAKYGMNAPRYTSYPTAPHFTLEPSETEVADFVGQQPESQPVSLYFHIPFCHQLCHYCGCLTKVINYDRPLQDYLALLLTEIKLLGEKLSHKPRVSHIHFGGGTPNLMTADDLKSILDTVSQYFILLDTIDIAMEIDPRRLSAEKVQGYAALGLTRASLGVQDLQPAVQHAINRVQPYEMIEQCVEWLRAAGIKSINFDLMYGLPLQTVEGIEDNIKQALRLNPDRIALFGYAHVPWMRSHQKLLETHHMPDIEERFMQQQTAAESLVQHGYEQIGMDHFALHGDGLSQCLYNRTMKRNFQGYTADDADVIIGFGLSSISSLPGAYIQNTADASLYRKRIEGGKLPVVKGCLLSTEDMMRREIISDLMCYFEVDLNEVTAKYGYETSLLKNSEAHLEKISEDGLLTMKDGIIKIHEHGRPFVRLVCVAFDAYIEKNQEEGKPRHAKAV